MYVNPVCKDNFDEAFWFFKGNVILFYHPYPGSYNVSSYYFSPWTHCPTTSLSNV